MFRNYATVALRQMRRQKAYSLINIIGLAAGMAVCILILLWVQDELRFDRFHANLNQLYRVVHASTASGADEGILVGPFPLVPAVKSDIPEVVLGTRVRASRGLVIQAGENRFYDNDVCIVDNDFLRMFTFPVVFGDSRNALADPGSIVLTRSVAGKCFGNANPIGQNVLLDREEFTVSAVVEDVPPASHIQFDCLVSVFSEPPDVLKDIDDWGCYSQRSYLMLDRRASSGDVAQKMTMLVRRLREDSASVVRLQRMCDAHLYSGSLAYGLHDTGDIRRVYLFSGLAALILLIACMNFMNLSTARAGTRLREIGMRKVVGAARGQLARQFLGESVVLAVPALLLAIGAVELALPSFSEWCGKDLHLDLVRNGGTVAALLVLTLATGLFAGSYPALYLSRLRPTQLAKPSPSPMAGGRGWVRRMLVVSQFGLSVFLLIAAGVIHSQVRFATQGDLGYDPANVFCIKTFGAGSDSLAVLKNEVLRQPGVTAATLGYLPISVVYSTSDVDWEGRDSASMVHLCRHEIDYDYFRTFGVSLIAGRLFSEEHPTDATSAFVINEAAASLLNAPSAVGATITYEGHSGEVIGVVKDYRFTSLHDKTDPLVLVISSSDIKALSVKVHPDHAGRLRAFLERRWRELFPDYNWDGYFLEDKLVELYDKEQRVSTMVTWSSLLAVVVSCLGLLGLAAHAAERRSKEVGIRKVLGATVGALIGLLTREFALLVALANVVAWPVAYLVMKNWLDDFAYRASISPWLFVGAAAVSLGLALVTVSILTFRTANTNPSDVLRQE